MVKTYVDLNLAQRVRFIGELDSLARELASQEIPDEFVQMPAWDLHTISDKYELSYLETEEWFVKTCLTLIEWWKTIGWKA